MASEKKTDNDCIAAQWLEEDNLMLIECWSRDGYTFQDIANRIGVSISTLRLWRVKYPEINEALKKGREIIDYKVENALLKSALGYKTKEVKVTTTMRHGKVVETIKEVLSREQSPNVSAIQCWLYNRLPNKWKKNRDQLIELDEEDAKIQVIVTRASAASTTNQKADGEQETNDSKELEDKEWQDEVNQSIEIRGMTEKEKKEQAKKRAQKSAQSDSSMSTKVEFEPNDESLDYWPDDWEDEDSEETES